GALVDLRRRVDRVRALARPFCRRPCLRQRFAAIIEPLLDVRVAGEESQGLLEQADGGLVIDTICLTYQFVRAVGLRLVLSLCRPSTSHPAPHLPSLL